MHDDAKLAAVLEDIREVGKAQEVEKEDLDSLEERLVARLKRWIYETAQRSVLDGGSDSHIEFRASFAGFDPDDVPCLDVRIEDHAYESVDGLRVPAAKVKEGT